MTIRLKQFTRVANVGDRASALLVEHVTGLSPSVVDEEALNAVNLIAVGSIAQWADSQSYLWGCGLLSRDVSVPSPKKVLALRGKLTRDLFTQAGVSCSDILGDPAVLLTEMFPRSQAPFGLGVVPHYVDVDDAFVARCRAEGVKVLDVGMSPEDFVRELTSCERILSSSLHGIVIAHAYGIPAAWVKISDKVLGDGFKFSDYYSSVGESRPQGLGVHESLRVMSAACALPAGAIDKRALREAVVSAMGEIDVD